jgi:hypothetical protein
MQLGEKILVDFVNVQDRAFGFVRVGRQEERRHELVRLNFYTANYVFFQHPSELSANFGRIMLVKAILVRGAALDGGAEKRNFDADHRLEHEGVGRDATPEREKVPKPSTEWKFVGGFEKKRNGTYICWR